MAGRKEKFNEPSSKRSLRLPNRLWNVLDEIGNDNGKIAQDVIYDKLEGIVYIPQGNFHDLVSDIQEVIKKHKLKE